MPILELTAELVREIIESYGQIRKLNLSTNEISRVENLEGLSCLTKLNLSANRLGPAPEALYGLSRLSRLKELELSGNGITSLEPLSLASASMERLNMANNDIAHVDQVSFLASLTALTQLVLLGNPASDEEGYRSGVFHLLPSLQELDRTPRALEETPSEDRESGHQSAQQCTDATLAGERIVGSPPPEEITYVSSESSDEAMQLRHRICPENVSREDGFSRAPCATFEDNSRARSGDGAVAGRWAPDMTLSTSATRRTRTAPVSEESAGATTGGHGAGFVGCDDVASFENPGSRNCGHFAEVPRGVEGQFAAEQPGWARKGHEPKPNFAGYQAGINVMPSIDSFPARQRLAGSFDLQPHETQVRSGSIGDMYAGIDQGSPTISTDHYLGHQKMGAASRRAILRPTAIATGLEQYFQPRVEPHFAQNGASTVPVLVGNAGRREMEEADCKIRTSEAYLGGSSDADWETSATNTFAPTPPAAYSRATPAEVQLPRSQTEHTGRNPFEVEYPTPPPRFVSSAPATVVSRNRIGSELSTIAVSGSGGSVDGGAASVVAHNSDRGRSDRAGAHNSRVDQQHVNASNFDEIQSSEGCNRSGNPFDEAPRSRKHRRGHEQQLGRSFAAATAGKTGAARIDLRSSLPWGWGPVEAPPSTVQAPRVTSVPEKRVAHQPLPIAEGSGCGEKILMVDRREWDALKRENDALRRQAVVAEKRCSALAEMQHLADRALAIEHVSRLPPPRTGITATSACEHNERKVRKTSSNSSQSRLHDDEGREDGASECDGVSKLLGLWRSEVLKLLLQRGDSAEQAAAECRKTERSLQAERGARVRAEAEAKALTQRALAAEAETELLGIKLERALEDLRENRTGRLLSEASSSGHATAVRDLREWVQRFVGKASEGFYEREALLARGVAKLEAFSQRVGLAAGRLELMRTLLQRKEVQLRNSRAALVADRRVWLLERRQRELAALANAHPQSSGDQTSQPRVSQAQPLLEGLRPECEAVMRALFCRVDRLGTGAVRARRLLDVLRSDCGVSELMEASVGSDRWHAALNAMDARLCPTPNSDGDNAGDFTQGDQGSDERTVTWGEFLLFFLPSAGPSDDAYNAGLVPGEGGKAMEKRYRCASTAAAGTRRPDRSLSEAVPEDALAMLQMVIPRNWTVEGMPTATSGGVQQEGGLVALSVGQLRREVRRLARERAFLLRLLQEDGRLAVRRAEAVHDQYRYELRALHARIGEVEGSLEEAMRRTNEERGKADAVHKELSGLTMKMEKAEHDWQRKLEVAAQEKAAALEASSREAARAASVARERVSRIEAKHALALRENGKASVRQRALERELSRIKKSLQTEAWLEKEALEERLRAGDAKLTVARRERNALLAALRDIQRNGRRDGCGEPNPRSPFFTPLASMDTSGTDAGEARRRDVLEAGEFTSNELGKTLRSGARSGDSCQDVVSGNGVDGESDTRRSDWVVVDQDAEGMASDSLERRRQAAVDGRGGASREGLSNSAVGASRSASLTVRLEKLAAQTQELLAEDSDDADTSCSSDDLDS